MKQVFILWNDGETTTICGKYAFRIAINYLDRLGVFNRFDFLEIHDTYFFIDDDIEIEWIIKPRKVV